MHVQMYVQTPGCFPILSFVKRSLPTRLEKLPGTLQSIWGLHKCSFLKLAKRAL